MRSQIELGGQWSFLTDKDDAGVRRRWFRRPPAETRSVEVPGAWNLYDPSLFAYRGPAWYFRHFRLDELPAGGVVRLRFEGVQHRATVWLDGREVGGHVGSYTPFEFDVTGLVKPGRSHLLAVRVDNTLNDTTVPPWGVDYFVYGGIFREVRLRVLPALHLADERVVTHLDGRVEFEVALANAGASGGAAELEVALLDDRKQTAAESSRRVACAAGRTARARLELRVRRPRLWDISDPYLYEARIRLRRGGEIVDERRLDIGIREIAARGSRILLNGRPVKLHGISRHEDHPQVGNVACEELLVRDYTLIKQANCNMVRLAHYTHSEKELAVADRMGLLVFAEIPNLFMTEPMLARPEALASAKQQLGEMIARDKNHPSVVFWGLAIECRTDKPVGEAFMRQLFAHGRRLDRTRLFIHASDRILKERCYKFADVIGCNAFQGWYDYSPPGTFHRDVIRTVHRRFPDKPILLSSHGAEGLAGLRTVEGERWTEDYQALYLESVANQIIDLPYVSGEMIWHFMDFRIDRWNPGQGLFSGQHSFKVRPGEYNNKGIVDRNRQPKLAFYKVRDIYARWKKLYAARPPRSGSR